MTAVPPVEPPPDDPIMSISVQTSVDINDDSPVAIDLVFALNEAVVLPTQSDQWFADKHEILHNQWPGKITVIELEMVPRESIVNVAMPPHMRLVVKATLYSTYSNPTEAAGKDFTAYKNLLIVLTRDRIELRDSPES